MDESILGHETATFFFIVKFGKGALYFVKLLQVFIYGAEKRKL